VEVPTRSSSDWTNWSEKSERLENLLAVKGTAAPQTSMRAITNSNWTQTKPPKTRASHQSMILAAQMMLHSCNAYRRVSEYYFTFNSYLGY
jgi:hypothetical protein